MSAFGDEIRTIVREEITRALAERGPETVVVHYLQAGRTPCVMSEIYGVPGVWPPGHRWSADWSEVTHPKCLARKPSSRA